MDAKRSEEALQAEAEEAKRAEEEVERIAMAEMRERRTMERAEAECRPLQAHWTMAYQRRRRRAAQSAEMKAREPTPEVRLLAALMGHLSLLLSDNNVEHCRKSGLRRRWSR